MADFQTPCPLSSRTRDHIVEVLVLFWVKVKPLDHRGLSAFMCTGAHLGQMRSYSKVEVKKKMDASHFNTGLIMVTSFCLC